jgi:hypothetical protein
MSFDAIDHVAHPPCIEGSHDRLAVRRKMSTAGASAIVNSNGSGSSLA